MMITEIKGFFLLNFKCEQRLEITLREKKLKTIKYKEKIGIEIQTHREN